MSYSATGLSHSNTTSRGFPSVFLRSSLFTPVDSSFWPSVSSSVKQYPYDYLHQSVAKRINWDNTSNMLSIECSPLLFSHQVSNSLWPHGLQNNRLPCPLLSPGVCSDACSLSWWCYVTISPLLPPSPPALSRSQHQGLFRFSSLHHVAKVVELHLLQCLAFFMAQLSHLYMTTEKP